MLNASVQSEIFQVWAPPPKLTVSEWADRYRELSPEASAEPGKWRTSRAPYQREIMDAVNDPEVETVVFMKAAQVGATEILNNIVGYFISQDPAPILVIQPTLEMAHTWSKDRFAKMVRDTEILKDKIKPPRSKDSANTILHKVFPGGHITIAGANSAASLASRPIRIVMCDEIDRYPASAGTEGDPVTLAIKRSETFWNRLIFLTSTPTIKGLSRIEAAFQESDQRYYYVPCPDCGKYQRLVWGQVRWEKDNDGNHLPETARYVCEFCGAEWNDSRRWAAVRQGRWIAHNPNTRGMVGFHISALYSPWVKLADMVDEFIRAKDNPERLKVFVNTSLGEPWEDEGDQVQHIDLMEHCEKYPAPVPEGGLVLTAGVDVQDDRIEGEVVAWGIGEESWSVEYFTLFGDPAKPDLWVRLDQQLQKTYEHHSGISLKISCVAVDTGGHFTEQTYKFVKGKEARRIFGVKGSSVPGHPLINRGSRSNKYRIRLFTVGTDTAKELIYARMRIEEPGAGYMHFPDHYDEEYFLQLTAEKAVTKYRRGFPYRVWVKTRSRNEALDCRVYAMAALAILNPYFEAISKSLEKIIEEKERKEGERQKKVPPRKSWVNKWKG